MLKTLKKCKLLSTVFVASSLLTPLTSFSQVQQKSFNSKCFAKKLFAFTGATLTITALISKNISLPGKIFIGITGAIFCLTSLYNHSSNNEETSPESDNYYCSFCDKEECICNQYCAFCNEIECICSDEEEDEKDTEQTIEESNIINPALQAFWEDPFNF